MIRDTNKASAATWLGFMAVSCQFPASAGFILAISWCCPKFAHQCPILKGKVPHFSLGAGRQSRYTLNCLFDDEGLSAFLNVGRRDVVF
jgi:hypothetical protein